MDQYHEFQATFHEESTYDRLRLPLVSTTNVVDMLRDGAILRDAYGNNWPVGVEVVGDSIFFVDGWRSFSKHNYLENGDVVIFRNAGTPKFDVRIFGSHLSEKRGIGRKVCTGRGKKSLGVDESIPNSKSLLREGKEVKVPGHAMRLSRKRVDPLGTGLFKQHPNQKPLNPFFVTCLRKERKSALIVPISIVDRYGLNLPDNIYLEDSARRRWDAYRVIWKDGRQVYCGGGLRKLCQVNAIDPDDILICEFVRSERRGIHTIRVNVFQP